MSTHKNLVILLCLDVKLQVFFKSLFSYRVQILPWSGMHIVGFFRCWCLKCLYRELVLLHIHWTFTSMSVSGVLRLILTFHVY